MRMIKASVFLVAGLPGVFGMRLVHKLKALKARFSSRELPQESPISELPQESPIGDLGRVGRVAANIAKQLHRQHLDERWSLVPYYVDPKMVPVDPQLEQCRCTDQLFDAIQSGVCWDAVVDIQLAALGRSRHVLPRTIKKPNKDVVGADWITEEDPPVTENTQDIPPGSFIGFFTQDGYVKGILHAMMAVGNYKGDLYAVGAKNTLITEYGYMFGIYNLGKWIRKRSVDGVLRDEAGRRIDIHYRPLRKPAEAPDHYTDKIDVTKVPKGRTTVDYRFICD